MERRATTDERLNALFQRLCCNPDSSSNIHDACPTNTLVTPTTTDEREANIEAFLRQPITSIDFSRFENVTVFPPGAASINDLDDKCPGSRPVFNQQVVGVTTNTLVTPTTHVNPLQNEREAMLEAFLQQPIAPLDFSWFANVTVVSPFAESINAWDDKCPGARPVFNLIYLSDEEIITLGAKVFGSIKKGLTLFAVGNLMLLAYNLRDNTGVRVFGDVAPQLYDLMLLDKFENLAEDIVKPVTCPTELIIDLSKSAVERQRKLAIGYCYLACSYMRLYAKPAEDYVKIGGHLKSRFGNYYKFSLPFDSYHPELEIVQQIKSTFELNRKIKNTFYNLLYAGEVASSGRNIKEFLYALHVSYTGLHPYTLFARCMAVLKVTNKDLLAILYCKMIKPETTALVHVFDNLLNTEDGKRTYQMWKYAKIFESKFLSRLQTKNCKLFTLVLAYMLSIYAKDHGVLKIAQIQNMSENMKVLAQAYALRALQIHEKYKRRA